MKYSINLFFILLFFEFLTAQNHLVVIKINDRIVIKKNISNLKNAYSVKDSTINSFKKNDCFLVNIDSSYNNKTKIYKFNTVKKPDSIYILKPNNSIVVKIIENFSQQKFKNNKLPVQYNKISDLMNYLVLSFNNSGYPFASFSLKNINFNNDKLTADINFNKGEKRLITDIKVLGYSDFPKKYITRIKAFVKNKHYNNELLFKLNNIINDYNFVSSVKLPEILFKKDSTIAYVYLKKKKNNYFDGLIGFSNDSTNSKILFDGFLKLKLNNAFNKGNSYFLSWLSNKELSKLNLISTIPYIYGTAINTNFNFNLEKRTQEFLNTNAGINISYFIKQNKGIFINYKISNSFALNNDENQVDDLSNYFIGLGLEYKIKQNNNIKSDLLILKSSLASGKRKSVTGKLSQKEIKFRVDDFISIHKNLFFENSFQYNKLISENYLINELYFTGEGLTYRSLKNLRIPASDFIFIKNDLKLYLDKANYLAIISDYGIFNNKTDNSKIKTISIGAETEFKISDNGILKMNFIVNNQDNFGFKNGVLGIQLLKIF